MFPPDEVVLGHAEVLIPWRLLQGRCDFTDSSGERLRLHFYQSRADISTRAAALPVDRCVEQMIRLVEFHLAEEFRKLACARCNVKHQLVMIAVSAATQAPLRFLASTLRSTVQQLAGLGLDFLR